MNCSHTHNHAMCREELYMYYKEAVIQHLFIVT